MHVTRCEEDDCFGEIGAYGIREPYEAVLDLVRESRCISGVDALKEVFYAVVLEEEGGD